MGTVVVGNAYWKNSIKNDEANVVQNTYTIQFQGGSESYTFAGLEFDSSFEMPILSDTNFSGWGPTSGSNSGPAYKGLHRLYEFAENLNNNTLVLYAKYGIEVTETHAYTATNFPNWVNSDDAVIFAWVWNQGQNGSWRYATKGTNNDATFIVSGSYDWFLLVRCAHGTTTPSWSVTGNDPGRIYNQTEDYGFQAGVYTYPFPQEKWSDYNP